MERSTFFQRAWSVLLCFLLCVAAIFDGWGNPSTAIAHAEEVVSKEAFEERNVLEDLQDATKDGETFTLDHYGFQSNQPTSLLTCRDENEWIGS